VGDLSRVPCLQVHTKSDIYIFSSSASQDVVPKDNWLTIVSTSVEP
jgi:hypothetical protein